MPAWPSRHLGSAPARLLRLPRAHLAALGSSALPGRGRPTGAPSQCLGCPSSPPPKPPIPPALDPSGLQLDLVKLSAANTRQQHICRELQGAMKALGGGGGEGSAEEEEEAARRVELASKFDGTIGDIAPQP